MKSNYRNNLLFWLYCLLIIWVTHAITYFCHEYSHSFAAWVLGYRTNPLAIDYGGCNLGNLLLQSQVDDNVSYQMIFAQGHGRSAALIAFAGIGFGNVLLYLFSRILLNLKRVRYHALLYLFSFWLCLMNIGNFFDYVPIRTFTTHGDIAYISQGLSISPWLTLIFLGYPTVGTILHFYLKVLPKTFQVLSLDSKLQQGILVFVTTFLLFDYFGAAGFNNCGDVSHTLSGISMLSFPVIVVAFWFGRNRKEEILSNP